MSHRLPAAAMAHSIPHRVRWTAKTVWTTVTTVWKNTEDIMNRTALPINSSMTAKSVMRLKSTINTMPRLAPTPAMSVIFPASTALTGTILNTTNPLDFHSPFRCLERTAFQSPSHNSTRMTCSTFKNPTFQVCNRVPWHHLSMCPCIINVSATPSPTGTI